MIHFSVEVEVKIKVIFFKILKIAYDVDMNLLMAGGRQEVLPWYVDENMSMERNHVYFKVQQSTPSKIAEERGTK